MAESVLIETLNVSEISVFLQFFNSRGVLFLSSWKSREALIRAGVLIRENMVITVVPVLGFLLYQQSSY